MLTSLVSFVKLPLYYNIYVRGYVSIIPKYFLILHSFCIILASVFKINNQRFLAETLYKTRHRMFQSIFKVTYHHMHLLILWSIFL